MISIDVPAFEIVEQAPALRDHLEQAAPRVVVFLVCFEMLRQLGDALAEQSDLHFGRARVAFVRPVLADDVFFGFSG